MRTWKRFLSPWSRSSSGLSGPDAGQVRKMAETPRGSWPSGVLTSPTSAGPTQCLGLLLVRKPARPPLGMDVERRATGTCPQGKTPGGRASSCLAPALLGGDGGGAPARRNLEGALQSWARPVRERMTVGELSSNPASVYLQVITELEASVSASLRADNTRGFTALLEGLPRIPDGKTLE